MELGYWISIGVAALSFLTTIIGFVVNVVKELKFKKLEQKIGLYLRGEETFFTTLRLEKILSFRFGITLSVRLKSPFKRRRCSLNFSGLRSI